MKTTLYVRARTHSTAARNTDAMNRVKNTFKRELNTNRNKI